jgi:hypothetical protein
MYRHPAQQLKKNLDEKNKIKMCELGKKRHSPPLVFIHAKFFVFFSTTYMETLLVCFTILEKTLISLPRNYGNS